MRLKRFLPTIVVAASCAFCSPAQSQAPKKEYVDAFMAAFRHFLAVTSAGVDECGSRFPERKDEYRTALESVRIGNLYVIVRAELGQDFAEFLTAEKAHAAAATNDVMAEYCADLPRAIDVVSKYAAQLRLVLEP